MRIRRAGAGLVSLFVFAGVAGAASGEELFFEDFEGVTLGPNVDELLAEPNAWTPIPPTGWSVDSSGVPGFGTPEHGVTEWAGWSFANRDWWVEAAGDQRRSEFVSASGNIAVADPDEWDDLPHPFPPDNGGFDAFMSTPPIAVVSGDLINLSFDSSWRPEFDDNYHQTANIIATFDVGSPVEVLRWESDALSLDFHDHAPNELVSLDIDVPPGASEVVLTLGLFDAGNDWWWAVDNIAVTGEVPEPASALMLVIGGLVLFARHRPWPATR